MKLRRLDRDLWVPRPLDEVFAFFADAHNLNTLTPPWLKFAIVTPAPIQMRRGTLIDYQLRVHGVPLRWRSEITAWDPPHYFVDQQRRGPYRVWHHEHSFAAVDGGTRIEDHVQYLARGGLCEPLLHRGLVRPDLERIFAYRQSAVASRFGAGAPGTAPAGGS